MAVANGIDNGSYGLPGLLLGIGLLLHDAIKELTSFHKLHHQIERLALIEDLNQSDNIGVVQLRKDLDLQHQAVNLIIIHRSLLDDLDGHWVSFLLVDGFPDNCIGSSAKLSFFELVEVQNTFSSVID